MKKLLYGLCALLMVFFVASCDSKKSGDEKEKTEKSSKKKKKNKKNKDADESSSKYENADYDDDDDFDKDDDVADFEEFEKADEYESNASSGDLKSLLKSASHSDNWSVDQWVSWYRKTINSLAVFVKSNPSKSEYLAIKELSEFDDNISSEAKKNMRAAENILEKDKAFMQKMMEVSKGIDKLDNMYDD